jgi:hypothetical protein
MAAENLLKQVHLGARLGDEIKFSERMHRLDTAASVSALRDIVRRAFGPAGGTGSWTAFARPSTGP